METVQPGDTVTIRTKDAYDGLCAVVNRIWSSGDVSVNVGGEDICVSPHEIEGMETHSCEKCGAPVTPLNGHCEIYRDYLWDGSDGEGSILHTFERWTCADLPACSARRIHRAQGAMVQAESEDASARENGFGAIRNF